MRNRRSHGLILLLLTISLLQSQTIWAGQNGTGKEKAYKLPELRVKGVSGGMGVALSPDTLDMDLDDYHPTGSPSNILDVLKQGPIIDFRQASDLAPAEDGVQMRGFDTRMFVTSLDGLAVQKIGGYWGAHYLDFTSLPLSDIEEIEIIPGPHSSLYPGKAIGGVLNLKTASPERRDSYKPDVNLRSSYGTYDTRNHLARIEGGYQALNYGLSYRDYSTNGYLRNNAADIQNISAGLGYLLPSSGYVRISGSYTDKLREVPAKNDPSREDYDSDYPVVREDYASYAANQDPRRDKDISLVRLDAEKPTPWGDWKLGVYRKREDQVYKFNPDNLTKRGRGSQEEQAKTDWLTWQGKLQNDFSIGDHDLTFGLDMARLFMEDDGDDQERERTYAGFVQDEWSILPTLSLKAGLRYDYQSIWWENEHVRKGELIDPNKGNEIEKDYTQLVPKSFLTYDLDNWAKELRDTSVSLGVSRIWTPREFCSI